MAKIIILAAVNNKGYIGKNGERLFGEVRRLLRRAEEQGDCAKYHQRHLSLHLSFVPAIQSVPERNRKVRVKTS